MATFQSAVRLALDTKVSVTKRTAQQEMNLRFFKGVVEGVEYESFEASSVHILGPSFIREKNIFFANLFYLSSHKEKVLT